VTNSDLRAPISLRTIYRRKEYTSIELINGNVAAFSGGED